MNFESFPNTVEQTNEQKLAYAKESLKAAQARYEEAKAIAIRENGENNLEDTSNVYNNDLDLYKHDLLVAESKVNKLEALTSSEEVMKEAA